MEYFAFFDMKPSFLLDEAELKKRFYANSKKLHPDFYTLESPEKQQEVLEQSTYNNKAYKTLADPDSRMRYILEAKGLLAEEGENKDIPQDFLMEMMEINEKLMELEFDFDPVVHREVSSELEALENRMQAQIDPVLQAYDEQGDTQSLEAVKAYYLKRRYLLRIHENLNKFAGR